MSIQIDRSNIDAVYYGGSQIGEIYCGAQLVYSSGVRLIINTAPADASVTFSTGKVSGHQTKVKKGTTVTYTVSKNGYYGTSGTVTVNSNQTLSVERTLRKGMHTNQKGIRRLYKTNAGRRNSP